MVLPLLMSVGLPALAGTGSVPLTGALGALPLGYVSTRTCWYRCRPRIIFIQTGDIGKGIQTGLTSFLAVKILGGLHLGQVSGTRYKQCCSR